MNINVQYLERAQKAREKMGESFTINGDTLLIEQLQMPTIKRKSGIEIPGDMHGAREIVHNDKAQFVIVLDVGAGFYDSALEKDVPLATKPGEVLLISTLSAKYFLSLPISDYTLGRIGTTREPEIAAQWNNLDAFIKYWEAFDPDV